MNNFLKNILTLATELNKVHGFNALIVIDEMELLYKNHVIELKEQFKADVSVRRNCSCCHSQSCCGIRVGCSVRYNDAAIKSIGSVIKSGNPCGMVTKIEPRIGANDLVHWGGQASDITWLEHA